MDRGISFGKPASDSPVKHHSKHAMSQDFDHTGEFKHDESTSKSEERMSKKVRPFQQSDSNALMTFARSTQLPKHLDQISHRSGIS